MINKLEKLFKVAAVMVMASVVLWSCESDADQLGSQYLQNGVQGTEAKYPIIAYNFDNNDTIRTDAVRLQNASLGAFSEGKFGMQKSDYFTQVRLAAFNPEFGTNPVLDSAVLSIKPNFARDSVTTNTKDDFVYNPGAIPAQRVLTTYPVIKYGKTKIGGKTTFNIKVHEVTDFLYANSDKVMSDKNPSIGALLGTKVFNGDVTAVKITKKADNSVLLEREAGIRIKLDSTFISNKILKGDLANMTDAASFIRYFKGIRISVDENDGYLFNFDPNALTIKLYYKKDKVSGATTTREEDTFDMDLGTSNVHFNHISFNRAGTPSAAIVKDTLAGAPRIYAQGMGGPGIGLRIPGATIAGIRDLYNKEKIGIVSAKIRLYTDEVNWNNSYAKPDFFTVKQKGLDTFLEDMSTLAITGIYRLVKAYDLNQNPARYDIDITQTMKNIIELQKPSYGHFVANVGNYTQDLQGGYIGLQYPSLGPQNFNSRSYSPFRVILIGTEGGNEKAATLLLTYGKK